MKIEFKVEGILITVEAEGTVSLQVSAPVDVFSEDTRPTGCNHPQSDDVPEAESDDPVMTAASMDDADLFERLSALRRELAHTEGVPPYVVFKDNALHEMAEKRPLDMTELSSVSGVGKAKLEKYGDRFLSVIKEA